MATITYQPSTITLPNITVEEKLYDGALISYRIIANDGYVMYNTASDFTYTDEDGNEYEHIDYFRVAYLSKSVPVSDWTWVAVPVELSNNMECLNSIKIY